MKSIIFRLISISVLVLHVFQIVAADAEPSNDALFPVNIIHINDFHARFEETNEEATSCKEGEKCIGGYARAVTAIKKLKKENKENGLNPIFLNAGDFFQGTMWYAEGRWNVTAQFFNMLNADAITLGNHEFDHGVEGIVPFLEHINSKVIVANIDDEDEPTIQGKYEKTLVIDRYGRKIGIIGIIISNVDELSNTGKLRFENEEEAIRRESKLLKEEGVDIIIVLSHCGLDIDERIAKEAAPFVDVIVGGHSHSFMYTVEDGIEAPGPDPVKDIYPKVVETNGHKVLIVQASAYCKYIGNITVYFDREGRVADWKGQPVYLDSDIIPDPKVLEAIQPWKEKIDKKGKAVIGHTKVPLLRDDCSRRECNLGNFIADALVDYYITNLSGVETGAWTEPIIAIVQTGAIRTTLNRGEISFNDLATTVPFENTIDTYDLQGKYLKEAFEHAVQGSWQSKVFDGMVFFQVSGARVVYDMQKPDSHRVVSVEVRVIRDNIPRFEPLDEDKIYKCVSSSFIADGGDGYDMILKHKTNHLRGDTDILVVMDYLKSRKSVYTGLENRIKFI